MIEQSFYLLHFKSTHQSAVLVCLFLEPCLKVMKLFTLTHILDTIAVAIVGLIIFATLTYLPGHLIMMVHFLQQIFEAPS